MQATIKKFNIEAEYYFQEGCFINELSNTADDAAVSVARARVLAGECTRWHKLRGITERYVIVSGEGRVEVGELDPTDVTEGDVVVIPPGCVQRIRNTGSGDLVFLAICTPRFESRFYEDIDPE